MMMIVDLLIVILIPIETIFDFNRNLKLDLYKYDKYNIFYLLQQQGVLLTIADIINSYLMIVTAGSIFYYFRFDMNIKSSRNYNSPTFSVISFMMLINGRFLTFIFFIFQILSIKCGFDSASICYGQTQRSRVIANFFGIFLNVLFFYYQYIYLSSNFPMNVIPWAKPHNKYDLVKRCLLLASCIIIVFIDFFTKSTQFFVILIPLFVI